MTEPLSYEEWRIKNQTTITPYAIETLKKFHNLDAEKEVEEIMKHEYANYVMELTNPEEYEKWKKEHFNEELGCYDMKEEQNEKTPEQLFEEVLMDRNGLSLMDLLVHPDLKTFVDNFEDNK